MLNMLQDQVSLPLVGAIILLVAYITHSKLTNPEEYPKNIPWVGRGNGWFSGYKARFESMKSSALEISDAGYKKVSTAKCQSKV